MPHKLRPAFRVGVAAAALCAFGCAAFALAPPDKDPPEVSSESYQVYKAIFDQVQIPKDDPYITIADRTLDFKCGSDTGALMQISGCDGIQVTDDQPVGAVMDVVKQGFSDASKATLQDFETQNSDAAKLTDVFTLAWRYDLFGKDKHADKYPDAKPNLTFWFSNVGFNPQRTEAIVYVVMFSYLDNVRSAGDFFFLRLKSKTWTVSGRINYFRLGDPGSGSQ